MYNSLNNLANAVKSDATNLAKLTMKNAKLAEKLKGAISQNKVLPDLPRKTICGVTETQSENHTENKRQSTDKTRGCDNSTSTEENSMIRSVIAGLAVTKLM